MKNRDIKFNAWCLDGSGAHTMHYWDQVKNSLTQYFQDSSCELIQYTGLKVFDEIEVYEGDKLSFVVFDCLGNDKSYEGYVVYDGSRFLLWNRPDHEFYGDDGGFDLDWVLSQDDEAKVIGNIYEK